MVRRWRHIIGQTQSKCAFAVIWENQGQDVRGRARSALTTLMLAMIHGNWLKLCLAIGPYEKTAEAVSGKRGG